MTYRLELEIPGLPKMANPSGARSTHWRYAKQEAEKWITTVTALVGAKRPAKPLVKFALILTRYSSVQPDYDGLVRGFKHVVDGLKHAGVIADDRLRNTGPWTCAWIACKPKEGRVRVVVIEDERGNA